MKKILILLILVNLSCKENNYEYENDSEAIEVTEAVDDTNNVDFVNDSIVSIPKDYVFEETTNKELTYEEALETTSIFDLKNFIKNNPNHKNVDLLNKRLIDLEVDEIFNDKNTGEMPKSDLINNSNSKSSSVSIKNDTSCELVIRYSGSISKVISIPSNQTKTINISSGIYRITASACGYNYSGNETLSGDYTSSYYISTTYR